MTCSEAVAEGLGSHNWPCPCHRPAPPDFIESLFTRTQEEGVTDVGRFFRFKEERRCKMLKCQVNRRCMPNDDLRCVQWQRKSLGICYLQNYYAHIYSCFSALRTERDDLLQMPHLYISLSLTHTHSLFLLSLSSLTFDYHLVLQMPHISLSLYPSISAFSLFLCIYPRTPKSKDKSRQNPNIRRRPVLAIFTSMTVLPSQSS
jgi:hypothetical protein